MSSYARAGLLLLVSSLSILTGCGPGRGDLHGKVTYDGKALASGSVTVRGSDGMPVGGQIKTDGTYSVKNIAAGLVTITVTSPDPAKVMVIARKMDAPPPAVKDNSKWFPIPEEYGDFEKSGLTYELKSGSNKWDIDLK